MNVMIYNLCFLFLITLFFFSCGEDTKKNNMQNKNLTKTTEFYQKQYLEKYKSMSLIEISEKEEYSYQINQCKKYSGKIIYLWKIDKSKNDDILFLVFEIENTVDLYSVFAYDSKSMKILSNFETSF